MFAQLPYPSESIAAGGEELERIAAESQGYGEFDFGTAAIHRSTPSVDYGKPRATDEALDSKPPARGEMPSSAAPSASLSSVADSMELSRDIFDSLGAISDQGNTEGDPFEPIPVATQGSQHSARRETPSPSESKHEEPAEG
jgi:hypothetical protein